MAPELLPADAERSERLRSARRSNQFIAEHLAEWMEIHAGKFAVVCNGELIALNANPEAAKEEARDAGADLSICIVFSIPKRGGSHYF